MAAGIHISISAEKLFSVGGLDITNSMFTSMIVSLILIVFAVAARSQLKKTSKPTGLQNFAEMIIEALHGLVHGVTGDLKKTRLFLPFISTFFLVILLNNWLGLVPGVGTIRLLVDESAEVQHMEEAETTEEELMMEENEAVDEHGSLLVDSVHAAEETTEAIPEEEMIFEDGHMEVVESEDHSSDMMAGEVEEEVEDHGGESHIAAVPIFRPGTADLNTTLAFAIISIFITQVIGVKYLKLGYFKKFINFSSPIMFFVGILELVSEFAKIISFAFRLFGNIFAGEVLLVVMAFLLPLVVPMPFYGLELFVGFIQALVFAMLSLVFFNMATVGHDDH